MPTNPVRDRRWERHQISWRQVEWQQARLETGLPHCCDGRLNELRVIDALDVALQNELIHQAQFS